LQMKKLFAALPLVALIAACGSNQSGSERAAQLKIVGSSTVYPFTTAVAEEFQRANPGASVVVESTGTGAGMKLFCAGVGADTPDLTNASRRIKASELEDCAKNGVNQVIEFPVGIDGLTLIESVNAPPLKLSLRDLYAALAAKPFGKQQTAQTWKDVNPALPATKIRVLGPPPTSGTRDSLNELFLQAGCESDPAMKTLKKSNEDQHKEICTKTRGVGASVGRGETTNRRFQRSGTDPRATAVLGSASPRGIRARSVRSKWAAPSRRRPASPTSAIPVRAGSTSTPRASISRPSRPSSSSCRSMPVRTARAGRWSGAAWCRSVMPTLLPRSNRRSH
jgi:phosphate transport system substrate-binding protein